MWCYNSLLAHLCFIHIYITLHLYGCSIICKTIRQEVWISASIKQNHTCTIKSNIFASMRVKQEYDLKYFLRWCFHLLLRGSNRACVNSYLKQKLYNVMWWMYLLEIELCFFFYYWVISMVIQRVIFNELLYIFLMTCFSIKYIKVYLDIFERSFVERSFVNWSKIA